jgi:hypothetical protein
MRFGDVVGRIFSVVQPHGDSLHEVEHGGFLGRVRRGEEKTARKTYGD